MPSAVLTKIRKRAVEIKRKHPGKKYQTALKEAGREYRTGKLSGTKKKSKAKVGKLHAVKVKHCVDKGRKMGAVTGGSAKRMFIRELEVKLGKLSIQHEWATTKTEKRQILRKMAEVKKLIRALA